jgi:hypothetical protein
MKLARGCLIIFVLLLVCGGAALFLFIMAGAPTEIRTPDISAVSPTKKPTAENTSTPEPGLPKLSAVTAMQSLHIRQCAGLECPITGWLLNGETVEYYKCDGEWAEIRQGWVKSEFLSPNPCEN